MESFVVDVPDEPYVDIRPATFHSFEVDLDAATQPTGTPDAEAVVALTWGGLVVRSRKARRDLLHGLTGKITSGLYAIMGPSGSGKTTLLNTLACRLDTGMEVTGTIHLNGQPYTNKELKWMSAYVMQDDLLNGHLTVEETLKYAAELRLPRDTPADVITTRVESVLEEMNLKHVRSVIIGTPLRKGISGGERKRVCVAMELLTRPLLLFLDEPTSGLDSVAALALVTKLKALSDARTCTVVCTIHQPQAKIFHMFDNLLLMNHGHIVYQGVAAGASRFFWVNGFAMPAQENPADYFLDVMASADRVKKLQENKTVPDVDLREGSDRPRFLPRDATPWHRQFLILFRRSMQEVTRKRGIYLTLILQSVIIAVLIGTVYLKMGTNQASISKRQSLLFFCCINQGIFGALLTINSFPAERILVLRERAAGTYHVSSYFLAKTTAETLGSILSPILFACTVYFIAGLQAVGSKFIIFTIFMCLGSLCATSLALCVSTWCKTTDLSVAVLPMALEITRLYGGFFLPPKQLPAYWSWLDALSYVKYTYIGISLNELQGLDMHCSASEYVDGPNNTKVCLVTSGQQTISQLGLDYITIGDCVGILIAFIIFTRVVAYLGLRYMKS